MLNNTRTIPMAINTIELPNIPFFAAKKLLGRYINITSKTDEVRNTCSPQKMQQQPNISFFIDLLMSGSICAASGQTCLYKTRLWFYR